MGKKKRGGIPPMTANDWAKLAGFLAQLLVQAKLKAAQYDQFNATPGQSLLWDEAKRLSHWMIGAGQMEVDMRNKRRRKRGNRGSQRDGD